MSQPLKNVLVIGAGGNLGPSILAALDSNPNFNVSVLSRQSSKSIFPSHVQVHVVGDSYPQHEVAAAFAGQDAIVNLTSPRDFALQKAFIDAAIKAGVRRYIPAEFGSKSTEPRVVAAVPFFKDKAAVTDYLVRKEKEGLTWTAMITGAFFDWGLKIGFLGFDLQAHKALIYDDGTAMVDTTLLSDIGKATVSVLSQPSENINKHVFVNTFQTCQNAILAALEAATGGKKWDIERTTAKGANEDGNAKLAKGDFSGAVGSVMGSMLCGEEWARHYGSDNRKILGRDTRGDGAMQEVVAKIVRGEEV